MKENEIDIVKLDFPECVRVRSGMYIGETDNPSVLLREIIDNSIDELYGSENTNTIYVDTSNDNTAFNVVADNGRGIPIIWDEVNQCTKTNLAVGSLHAGSKFNKADSVGIGLNGVGSSVTNAVSEKFIILSKITKSNYDRSISEVETLWNSSKDKSDLYYYLEFEKGIKVSEGALSRSDIMIKWSDLSFPSGMSTVVAFKPDPLIFKDLTCTIPHGNLSYVMIICKEIYGRYARIICNGNQLTLDDYEPYAFKFIKKIRVAETAVSPARQVTFYINFEVSKDLKDNDIIGSVNSLVVNRGVHVNYAKDAFSDALISYFNLQHTTTMSGLKMTVIALAGEVDFSSQTKERCTKLDGLYKFEVAPDLTKEFKKIFKANQDYFEDHIERLNSYVSSLKSLSTVTRIKSMISTGGSGSKMRSKMPVAIKDAATSDRNKAELFIVEGKSAAGPITDQRDPRFQAVMELRGVPLNTVSADIEQILNNEEMKNIIMAINMGVNECPELNNPRYGKILIATDADPDGWRIASLILGLFAKRMTFLLERGMVYVVNSPLYIQGDTFTYPEDDVDSLLDKSKPFTRVKGLGELSRSQVSSCITNPDTRRLMKITPEEVDVALELLTSTRAKKELMIEEKVVTDPFGLGLYI